jgi:putative ABC transport system permease protein
MIRSTLRRRVDRALARVLSVAYRDRPLADVFIAEMLEDAAKTHPWTGPLRVAALCITDAIRTRWRPDGYAITGAPISTSGAAARRRSTFMDRLMQDIRFGLRQLYRQPAFSLVAVLTMALGVGANTAIFNVAWQTLIKPLPYPDSRQLVEIWETFGSDARINLSMPAKFHDVRREAHAFQYVAAFTGVQQAANLTGSGEPEQLQVRAVSGDYFNVFGMAPVIGRTLGPADVTDGANAVVISEGLWRRRFASRVSILGTTITLDGGPSPIVGVMPEAFETSAGHVDLWAPMSLPPETERHTGHYLRVIGRLKAGTSVAAADAEVKAIAARAAKMYPDLEGKLSAFVTSLIDGRGTSRGDSNLRSGLLILTAAAAMVLLIACANLASLQLARGMARAREFGIRAALGASRARIIAQLLTEGLVIAVLGAAAGLFFGAWVLKQLSVVAPATVGAAAKAGPDRVVVGYGLAIALISAVVFALAPAWRAASGATRWLRQRADGGDRGSSRLRLTLVIGQIAAASVLLVGAALLITSLAHVMNVNPGFNPNGALTFDVSVPKSRYDSFEKQSGLFASIGERIMALPGVSSVCAINAIPFDTQGGMTYVPEGQTERIGATPRTVSAGCLETLGIPLTRGRMFAAVEPRDVAIVSESFARAAWPNEDPLGKRVHLGVITGPLIEIVGVSADILASSLEATSYPQFYQAWTADAAFPVTHMIVRTQSRPDSLFGAIRSTVREVDRDQAVAQLRTLNDVIARTTASRRFDLTLLGSFALVALLLSAVGVYGLLSQVVAQRTREIGVRLALGASPKSVVRLMLRHAGLALAVGIPLGVGGAMFASQLLRKFMFGLSETDPRVYAAVAIALAIVVFAAAWLPARRAAAVDPARTLR